MSHLERTLRSLETLTRSGCLSLRDEDVGNLEIRFSSDLTKPYNLSWWDDDPTYDEGFETQGTLLDAVQAIKQWYKTLESIERL